MVGVKSAEKINIMDTDAVFQAGGTCGFNASGTTTFTQRSVTIGKIKVNEALCIKSLETKYLQKALPAGSMYTEMVYAEDYSNLKAAKIAAQLETAIWQGDTDSQTANLARFDGLIKLAGADNTVVAANSTTYLPAAITTTTGIVAANVISIFDAVYKAIPAQIVAMDSTKIFCGQDVFRTYTIALKNANMFHYAVDAKADSSFYLPGTSIEVIATPGLNGTSKIYATNLENLFLGTDLLNEEEKFEIFYAKEADEVRFVSEFKMGVNYAFGSQVVAFILATP
jgi:uncharacterized protein YbcV (DUF1398 family)